MNIVDIFRGRSKHLFWKQLPSNQVLNGGDDAFIDADQSYFVVRLTQVYLYYSRKLWRGYHPMLYCYVKHGLREDQAVAGPGQLRDMTESDYGQALIMNHRLIGPVAFRGEDVLLQVGLYSVPGEDIAKTMLANLSTIAALTGVGAAPALQIASMVKGSVENIAGLDSTSLQLGVEDTFFNNNKLRAAYYVGINAPAQDIKINQLWLKDNRLMKGGVPAIATLYDNHDYMIIQIEKLDNRKDWPSFPEIVVFKQQFAGILGDVNLTVVEKRQRLAALWPQFSNVINESPELVKPDREQIALSVSADLKDRLKALEMGNPFEARSFGERQPRVMAPANFEFIDIPDRLDLSDPNSVREADRALSGSPFE